MMFTSGTSMPSLKMSTAHVDVHPFFVLFLGGEPVELVVDEGGDAVEAVEDVGDGPGHFLKGERGSGRCVGAFHLM